MEVLVFGLQEETPEDVSIAELREIFQSLGLTTKRSNTLARYLIEKPGQGDIIFNENLKSAVEDVLQKLSDLIGEYSLYRPQGSDYDDDPNYVQEEYLQKLILQNFGSSRDTLLEALKCEDYEE